MTLARRGRSIREHMTKVAATSRTDFFDPDHAVARVAQASNVRLVVGFEETWPAGARVKFGAGSEERQAAKAARVDSLSVIVEKDSAERSLRPVSKEHAPLFLIERCRNFLTLRVCRGAQIESAHY